jgi:tRNA A-37 threonylcarbamoyl transferase component Bud32
MEMSYIPCFHKILPSGKRAELEIELQQIAVKWALAPRIYEVIRLEQNTIVCMKKIQYPSLAELYGDDPKKIPKNIWKQIYTNLSILFEHEGIEYVDITPYNFMYDLDKDKVYSIDFGHAYYTGKDTPGLPKNWFLRKFLKDEECGWNPDFA